MGFPTETEERVRRKAFRVCLEHLRRVLETVRKVPQIIDCFVKGDTTPARQVLAEIRKAGDEVDAARRMVSTELAEIGAILISREDFLRFTSLTSEIADFSEGIAFRLLQIMEHKWKVPSDIKEGIVQLSDAVLETILRLRETAMALNYGSPKALEKAKEVESAERAVDDIYRDLEIKIIRAKIEIPALILLRDITQLLEDSADKAEDASNAARILSFTV
jgi:predicted phosphate transport protein (TIGR00153 family)